MANNQFGPWATPINAGMNPQLSSFWRRRLNMLAPASQTAPVLSWHNLLGLYAMAAFLVVLPTVRTISAAAEEQKAREILKQASQDGAKEDKTAPATQKPAERPAKKDEVKKAAKPSPAAKAAEDAYKATLAAYETGLADVEAIYRWSCRWMQAEKAEKGDTAIQAHLNRMEDLYKKIKALSEFGGKGGEATSLAAARYYVAEAEEMLEEAKKSPPDRKETSRGEPSNAVKADEDKLFEKSMEEFYQLYGLKEGECLKRIPPPFSPARLVYYRKTSPTQAGYIPEGPDMMCFRYGDGKLDNCGMSFGSSGTTISSLAENLLNIFPQEIDGDESLVNTPIPGDWVVRKDAPQKQVLSQFETILNDECRLLVKLRLREVQRKVFVARGEFRLPSEAKRFQIQIYGKTIDTSHHSGGGGGDFDLFLKHVGRYIRDPVISDLKNPPGYSLGWYFNDSMPGPKTPANAEEHDPASVLRHITEQTGLTFTEETRPVPVLFVEKAK